MKILHIAPIKFEKKFNIDSESNSPEGISKSVPSLANAQKQNGNYVGVISSSKSEVAVSKDIYWNSLKNTYSSIFLFLRVLRDFGKPDLIHIHDIYSLRQIFFSLFFILLNVKIFVSPRGCFSEIALSRSKIKKKLFLIFFKIYAFFIHSFIALNDGEKKQISKQFKNKRIIIISNGSDYDAKKNKSLEKKFQEKNNKAFYTVGYLGRFDVFIKGLDNLLKGYSNYQMNADEIQIKLVFVGEHRSKEVDSVEFFSSMQTKLPYPEMFIVKEPCYGIDKWRELASFDLLALPSRSEGMPNVALEAMSIGVPCMISPETNISEIILNSDSGWLVETNEKDIEFFFNNLIKIKKSELVKKGNNAKKFIKDNLTWDKIAKTSYFAK
tara:strand:+ start:2135 stop:3280 length:1146 start_codon:yes stop_codon:yes gene_type:complete